MADDLALLDRIIAETPPEKTVFIRVFRNSPEPAPWVVRLLTGDEDAAMRRHIDQIAGEAEQAAAWLREPFVFGALVSIDGVPVPADREYRRRLVHALGDARIAALTLAYRDLDREELAAEQAALAAPFPPGAASGPRSDASGTRAPAVSRSSPSPATTAAP